MKRIISFMLSLIMVISMLPVGALATTEEETAASQEQEATAPAQTAAPAEETTVTVSQTIVPDVGLPENEELYQIYVEQQFYGSNSVSFLGESAREQLTTIGGQLYDYLKTNIQNIASGKRASTVLELTADDLAAWGVTTQIEAADVNAAYSVLLGQLEEATVLSALLHDCPYDLYWYDKTTGVATSGSWYVGNGTFSIAKLIIRFSVAGNYQGEGYNASAPMVDTTAVSAVTAAAAKAQSIVAAYDAYPDYEKLKAYKEEICSLVSYDTAAASSGNYAADNDPWGLVNVFDGDTSTNVVCEGYSKAFQYLCDLSVFSGDVECYSVSGYMSGGTGAGAHMWNIVTIDGQNYLVDVTNSDAGTVGQSGFLFLAGTTGSVTGGYTFNSVTFTYNSDTMNLWGTGESSILHLAQTSYGAESGGEEETPDVPDTDFPFSDGEWEVLKLVNAERYSAGLKPLTGFAALQQAADVRAEELTESFSHTRPDGTTCFTVLAEVGLTNYSAAGENIFTGSASPATAMYAWMNSDGHRANILSGDYSHIGIGNYNYGWTQVFLGNSGYNSMTLHMPDTVYPAGIAIDDMGIYAVLNSSVYGDCYLPILGVYCTGYDPNLCGTTQTVTAFVLGYTVDFDITIAGHTEVIDAAVEATCTSTGLTEGKHCSACGEVLAAQQVVEALGHKWDNGTVTKEPTEKEMGLRTYTCTVCGAEKTEDIPMLEHTHSYSAVVTAPTCTEQGYTTHTCAGCGDSYVDTVVDAAGHTFSDWTVTVKPTCTEDGEKNRTCSVCGAEETETVALLGHTVETDAAVDATCTKTGLTGGSHCADCGEVLVAQEIVPMVNHTYGDWTVETAPTCTEYGYERRICTVCGAGERQSIIPLGHQEETAKGTAATCTEKGMTDSVVCSVCGEVLTAAEEIPALGHTYEDGMCTVCGEEEPLVCSGICGENVTWNFDKETGTLTISGTGAMEDYTEGTAPWYALISDIHSIIVETGVTYIGDYAFCGEGYYYTVTIPASVTELGSNLFIRDIEYIDVAFLGDAPAVKADTFTDICTYVSYPYSNPTYTQAFKDACGGKIIWCPVDDTGMYKAMGGCGEDLIWILDNDNVLTIEGFGDMEIYYAAMSPWWGYYGEIEKVILPEGLTSIRTIAFGDMNAFTSIEIPASVTRIEQDAFGYCIGLETITFLGDAPQFAESVFPGVTATACYPANNPTWTEEVRQSYGGNITWVAAQEPLEWSFDDITGTLTITGEGRMDDYTVDAPAPWNGFVDQIRAVRFEGSITSIGTRAFVDCTALESVSIPDSVKKIGAEAFFGSGLKLLALGNGVEVIGEAAFASCTELETVSMPASAVIGKNAFLGDRMITSVTVTPGNGIMTDYDFDSCVEMPWNRAGNGVTVTLAEGVTSIGSYAFYGSGVTSVSIPSTVVSIGAYAFSNCDGLTSITMPYGVKTIGDYAFFGIHNIASIEIPNSVKQIGKYAFAGSEYQSVTMPYGLTAISEGMFQSCGSLTSISFPTSLQTIGSYAFAYCTSLKGMVIPEGVTTLESGCFEGCVFYSLSLPESLTDIGQRAFYGNWNLTTVTIPSGVRSIQEYAFYGCDYLSLLMVESTDLTVKSNAFKNCYNLSYVGFAGTADQWENGVTLESGCGLENAAVNCDVSYEPIAGVKILNAWGENIVGTTQTWDMSKTSTMKFTALPMPENYSGDYLIEWTSDSDIISGTVNQNGDLTLTAEKTGTATVTAILYEVYDDTICGIAVADFTLQIKRLVSSIEISGGYGGYIATGVPTALTANVKPKNAGNKDIAWSVENVTGEATIDANGVITGTAPGKVYVWAMSTDGSGVGDLLELTVADYGVEITGAAEVMGGKSITLKAQLLPYNMTKTSIVWSLADPADKAYVTLSNGKITAKKVTEQHEVTVIASAKDGFATPASFTVTVIPTVTSIAITSGSVDYTGKTVVYDLNDPEMDGIILNASTLPLDAKDGITWTVSDKKGAYAEYIIDGSEISIANPTGKTGTVTLTAKATDGSGKTATVKVNFAKLAQSVVITNATEKLRGGAKVTLKTDIASDKSLTDKNVVWSVSDASVPYASVSAKGVLTTKAVYEQVTIEVTAQVKANPEKTHTVEITLCPAVTAAQIRSGGSLTTKGQTIYVDLADPTVDLTGSMLPASAIQEGTWTSSNKKIATVADGKVTVLKAGTATITFKASDGSNKSTTVKIVAGKWVDSIDVYTANDQHELRSGKTLQLKSKVLAADGGKPTNAGLTWTVSNTAAASVSSSGKVTAKTVYANTWVTVTASAKDGSGVSRSYDILIKPAKEETLILKLNGENVTASTQIRDLEAAEAEALTAWIYNSETETMEQVEPKYTLSNKNVSLAEGALTAVKTGSTVVTAKYGKLSAKVTIKVVRYVDTITVTSKNDATTLVPGKTLQLKAAVAPSNATTKTVIWAVSDPNAASVTGAGKVTAKTVYQQTPVTVTATAKDGSGVAVEFQLMIYPAAAGVTIKDAETGRTMNNRTVTVYLSQTQGMDLDAVVFPTGGDGAMQSVKWSSSSNKIATVDTEGNVTFLKTGTVTIKATTTDGTNKSISFKLVIKK